MPTRLQPLDPAALPPDARSMYDTFAATFPAVRGPWSIALRNADIARVTYEMYDRLCPRTHLGKELLELLILVVARRYTAQYMWFIHERLGREYGLAQSLIDAIRTNATPEFERDEERFMYDVTRALLDSWSLDETTYASALARLGEARMVELVTVTGFYAMLAMQLNTFAAAAPPDFKPLGPL